jgi:hypothetical protein
MTFREDGEGLNDRADHLDHEVFQAQKALNDARGKRLDLLEQEMADAQDRLNRMQASLNALRDTPPSSTPKAPAPLANLARAMPVLLPVGMVAMLGFAIGHSSARKAPRYPLFKTTAAANHARMTGSASTRGASYGGTEASTRIRWNGKVRKATGIDVAVGTDCRIEGRFASRGAHLAKADVEVWCGDKMVYEKGVYTGPEAVVGVDEYAVQGGSFVYNLDVEDVLRPGFDKRAMASIDTEARVAVISRDVAGAFRLEIDVEPVSAPIASSGPLFNTPRPSSAVPSARVARTARVVRATAGAPASSGDKCTVEVVPATPRSGWSCRTFVRCGDKALYGEQRTGYTECSGDDSNLQIRDLGFTLEDGDAKLDADLGKGTLTLSENDTSTWTVELKID